MFLLVLSIFILAGWCFVEDMRLSHLYEKHAALEKSIAQMMKQIVHEQDPAQKRLEEIKREHGLE